MDEDDEEEGRTKGRKKKDKKKSFHVLVDRKGDRNDTEGIEAYSRWHVEGDTFFSGTEGNGLTFNGMEEISPLYFA